MDGGSENSQAAQDADVMAYQEEMSRAVTPELAQEARNGLESALFARYYADQGGDLGGLEYEDAFQRFQAAMEVFGSGESKSLAWAFNQAKIPVPKQGMNSVLAYAARQMAAGAREAASVKNGDGTKRYSFKEIENLTEENEREILQDTVNGEYGNDTYVPLRRNTPSILIEEVAKHTNGEIKLEDRPIISEVKHLRQTMDEDSGSYNPNHKPHNISENEMIEIIKGMDDPAYIVLQENGRYVEVVRYRGDNGNGHSAWAVLDFEVNRNSDVLNGYPGGSYNLLVTAFEPDNLEKYLNRSSNTIIYEKAKDAASRGYDRSWSLHTRKAPFAESILAEDAGNVKERFSFKADDDYMAAAERGDEEEAQRMVDEAAKAAGVKSELKAGQGTEENYNYETLTAKPDMKIISLTGISDEDLNKINQSTTREFAKNILEGIKKRNHGSAQVYVNDIKRPVLIGTESIKHSIGRTLHKGYVEISQKLDEILSQAIAVNELNPRDNRTNYSTVLLGFAETDTQYYGVRFIVNNQTWKADSYDILYSISKSEIKKEGPVISTPGFPTKSDSGTPSTIRIADLLNLVKESPEISSVFSRNVAAKLGIERPNNAAISSSLRYSIKADTEADTERQAMEDVRADAELYSQAISDEFTRQAIDDFAEIYKAIERVARNMSGDGTQEGNWKKRTYEIANRLKTETGSTMSTKDAAKWISRVFQAIDKGGYVINNDEKGAGPENGVCPNSYSGFVISGTWSSYTPPYRRSAPGTIRRRG